MATEVQTGGEPPPLNVRDVPALPTGTAPAKPRYPVARPAPARVAPRLRDAPVDAKAALVEDLLSPTSVRSLAVSVAAHSVLLLILAFWYFSPVVAVTHTLDARLAGSEFGDPSGDQLKGGLGMDTPLAMPDSPDAPTLQEVSPSFTAIPVAEVSAPTPQARNANSPAAAANGGGVNLTNPGGAGNGDGFGVAKFGQGGENINGVDVKVGDPQFTLIWDSRADIDIHVIEPGGSEIFWENPGGGQGGELDVDDKDGFGPENVNYVQGRGPPGKYRWFVHYYGGFAGMAQKTGWKVRVKHAGRIDSYKGNLTRIGEKSRIFELKMEADNGKSSPAKTDDARARPADTLSDAAKAALAADATAVPAAPAVFAPAGVGFSVKLPSEPKTGRKEWDTPLGAVVAQTYTAEDLEGGVSVSTLDFPAATLAKADPGKLLDDMIARVLVDSKGKATREAKIALSGSAGREVEFTVSDAIVSGGGLGRARIYLAGRRLLIVSAVGTKGFLNSTEVGDLFKTFAITNNK